MTGLDCLLIADDLTGACDAAVQFARRGLATSVMLAMDPPPAEARVIAVSTDSRNLEENTAAELVATVADWLTARVVFKKIDSVLRGNPAAEIAAAMKAFHCDVAVATPAFPAMGRIVDSTNRAAVQHALRADVQVSPSGVGAALDAGARVISVDAESDADLDTIVSAAGASPRRVLWVGSGGLAAALARQWGGPPGLPGQRSAAQLIFCIGSDHPATLAQLAHLQQTRPRAQVLPPGPLPDCEALLLSGGDTASAVCREAGARRIDLRDEILPGIPWGILRCGRFDGLPVVTKSGGFGAADALLRVAEFFA